MTRRGTQNVRLRSLFMEGLLAMDIAEPMVSFDTDVPTVPETPGCAEASSRRQLLLVLSLSEIIRAEDENQLECPVQRGLIKVGLCLTGVRIEMDRNAQDKAPEVWHKTQMRIPLFEVDIGQAVYHGNYYHIFELAREDFLRELGYPYRRFMDEQLHLTVVEASCIYRTSLRYDNLIEIHTGIQWWRTRSLAFSQIIYRCEEKENPVPCTSATLNMVCVRFSGQPTILPAEFVDLLKDWLGNRG